MDPFNFVEKFLDEKKNYVMKLDKKGKPLIKGLDDLTPLIEQVPYNQMPNVIKIFNLKPALIGLLVSGSSVIGDKSIKNIIDEFLADGLVKKYLKGNYTVKGTSERLFKFILEHYTKAYKKIFKPFIEIIVSGYSKRYWQPEVFRLVFGDENKIEQEVARYEYKAIFGGQDDVIQRIVNGLDYSNFVKILNRSKEILNNYYILLQKYLKNNNINVEIPHPDKFVEDLKFFDESFYVDGIVTDISNFSEQSSIDFVDFLVDVMTKAQQFSNKLPTVGGDTHIALINKSEGFKWISKEEYKYKGYGIPKNG